MTQYWTCGNDPIMTSLSEHIDLESRVGVNKIKEGGKTLLVYNNTPFRKWNHELWKHYKTKGWPCYCVERSSLPNMAMIDKNGMLAESSSYDECNWNHEISIDRATDTLNYIQSITQSDTSLERQQSGRLTRDEFWDKIKRDPSKYDTIVFVPLQKEADTTIRFWADWIESVDKFVSTIYYLSTERRNILFLIKPHPLSQNKSYPDSQNVVNVNGLHYKDCIQECDKVYVINSGVGLQALMWQKPVYTFGLSHYQFSGMGRKVNNSLQALEYVDEKRFFDYDKMLRYIAYLKFTLWSDVDLSKGAKQCKWLNVRMN